MRTSGRFARPKRELDRKKLDRACKEPRMMTWFGRSVRKPRTWGLAQRLGGRNASSLSVLRAEVLEDRILPSGLPTLLRDINRATASSNPASLTQVNGLVFFKADDGTHGTEL